MAPRGGCRSYLLRRNPRVPGPGRIAAGDGGGTPVTRGQRRRRRRRRVAEREEVSAAGTLRTQLWNGDGAGEGFGRRHRQHRAVRKARRKPNDRCGGVRRCFSFWARQGLTPGRGPLNLHTVGSHPGSSQIVGDCICYSTINLL
jgi:hypothetical protein